LIPPRNNADSDNVLYNRAVEDWTELGGIVGVSEIMGWDENQAKQWKQRLDNINQIKNL